MSIPEWHAEGHSKQDARRLFAEHPRDSCGKDKNGRHFPKMRKSEHDTKSTFDNAPVMFESSTHSVMFASGKERHLYNRISAGADYLVAHCLAKASLAMSSWSWTTRTMQRGSHHGQPQTLHGLSHTQNPPHRPPTPRNPHENQSVQRNFSCNATQNRMGVSRVKHQIGSHMSNLECTPHRQKVVRTSDTIWTPPPDTNQEGIPHQRTILCRCPLQTHCETVGRNRSEVSFDHWPVRLWIQVPSVRQRTDCLPWWVSRIVRQRNGLSESEGSWRHLTRSRGEPMQKSRLIGLAQGLHNTTCHQYREQKRRKEHVGWESLPQSKLFGKARRQPAPPLVSFLGLFGGGEELFSRVRFCKNPFVSYQEGFVLELGEGDLVSESLDALHRQTGFRHAWALAPRQVPPTQRPRICSVRDQSTAPQLVRYTPSFRTKTGRLPCHNPCFCGFPDYLAITECDVCEGRTVIRTAHPTPALGDFGLGEGWNNGADDEFKTGVSFDGFVPGCPDPKLPFDHYSTLEWQVNRKCTKLDEAQRNITGHCDRRGRKATPIATTADTHLSCAATKEGAVIASTRLREKKGRMGAKHFIKRVAHNGGKGTSKSSDRIFSLMPHGVDDSHQPLPP